MPVTKLDDKGRILLPSEIRKAEKLKEGDEFAVDSIGDGVFIIKKIDLRSLLEEAIEKAKGIDHEKVEREIEEESNQLAKKRFEGLFLITTS
jgi:AbrB family transcriptional regulator (stage V sporulation protein T)